MVAGEISSGASGNPEQSRPAKKDRRASAAALPRTRPITVPVRATGIPRQADAPREEQLPLGVRIETWRKRLGYTLEELADKVGRSREWVRLFESGRIKELSSDLIEPLKQAIAHMDPSGWDGMQLREELEETEASRRPTVEQLLTGTEIKWLRTLSHEGMTFGNCIRYLRLSTGLSQVEFVESAKKRGIIIDPYTLDEYENNKSIPFPSNLTDVVKTAGLNTDTKPGQFLRLYAERHNLQLPTEGQFVMSLDDLQRCTFGTLMRYLRIQRGVTYTQLGVDLGYSSTSGFISSVERDDIKFPISAESVESFITWLNLASDSALAGIIRRKHSKKEGSIPHDVLDQVLGEEYLFKNHVDSVKSDQPLSTDLSMLTALQSKPSFQEKIEYLLDHGEIRPDIKARFWPTQKQYSRYLRDSRGRGFTMDEYMLCKLLMAHGYDIHDSITWDMLNSLRMYKGLARAGDTQGVLAVEEPVQTQPDMSSKQKQQ